MPVGPGKYDVVCTAARLSTMAQGVVLIVLDGHMGSGFSVQCAKELKPAKLAELLEDVARELRGAAPDNN